MAALDVKRVCSEMKETNPVSVKRLSLTQQNIKVVAQLSDCISLERIDLSKNEIEDAGGLGGCVQVSWINLSHNSLTSIEFASKMTQLTVLNAGYNRLQDVSPISKLTSLKALILNNNELNQLPKLDRLIHLNTLGTKLLFIVTSFNHIFSEHDEVVSHNHLESVDVTCLRSLVKLQASHNCLRAFPNIKFNAELKSLLLNENQISRVEEGNIGENKKLELVDLGKNEIRKFKHIRCLSSLPKVIHLNLKGNELANHVSYVKKMMQLVPLLQILDSQPVHRILYPSNASKNEKESRKRKLPVSDVQQQMYSDDGEVAAKKRTGQKKVESKSAANKTLLDDDNDDGDIAEIKQRPSVESLTVEKTDKKKKRLEGKLSPTPLSSEKKKNKKSESQHSADEEDLFAIGRTDDSAVGSFDAVSGRKTMNKKMRELAAAVKVVDLPQRRKSKARSIGLEALLEDDFGTIGESIG